jgi:hypothetical protein
MNVDILGLWLVEMLLPFAFVVAGVLFCFGFALVLIQSAGLAALVKRKE